MNTILRQDSSLKDSNSADHHLKEALARLANDNNSDDFLSLLKQLTKMQGGMSSLSKKVGINRQNLYRTFSSNGNPKFRSLATILKGLGYRISIEPIHNPSNILSSEQANEQ